MPRIDAHQHFWKFDPVRDAWIDDSMKRIQRDFYPQDLKPLLDANGFDGCVLVQTDQSEAETEFLLSLAWQYHFIKGIVGWINLEADDISERLAGFAHNKVLKGFRHVLQGEKQRDYMLRPAFMRGIGELQRFGYTYDILVYPDQLQYVKKFVAAFPDQPFVIDHLAKPYIRNRDIESWRNDMQAIAAFPNVSCKVSGMVTEADWEMWKEQEFAPYIDAVVEAFGVQRLMFGSDWPVCLIAAEYQQVVDIVRNHFASYTKSEQDLIFGTVATRFYKL
ncbi:amidohydrolase family protein [Chryseolinea sp. T2]|uniref:amidohydrolase family protein n=1 Tax=Chryseolinea sp. T2 TaxID=3129255 RepID=UPI003077B4BF